MSSHAATTSSRSKGLLSATFFGLRHSAARVNNHDRNNNPTEAASDSEEAPELVPVTELHEHSSHTVTTDTSAPPSSDARPASPPPGSAPSNILTSDLAPHKPRSLAGIALRAFLLGVTLCFGTLSMLYLLLGPYYTSSSKTPADADASSPIPTPLWRLPFFLAALSLFHFLEFYTTAAHNTPAADVHAFLLTANWPAYAIAHLVATLECLASCILFPTSYAPLGLHTLLLALGISCVVVGQLVRSLAMVTAGRSFNHTVQHRRADSHALVTTGIYAHLRHPSYFGFFWWAIGTQLVMGNVVSFAGYAVVLWKFFSGRIEHEEELLVRFFGTDYEVYRETVGTWIPFCR